MGEIGTMVCLVLLSALAIHITGSLVTLCILLCREFFVWDNDKYKSIKTKTLVILSFCVGWLFVVDIAINAVHKLFRNILTKR